MPLDVLKHAAHFTILNPDTFTCFDIYKKANKLHIHFSDNVLEAVVQ